MRTAVAALALALGGPLTSTGIALAAFLTVHLSVTSGEPGVEVAVRVDGSQQIGGTEQSDLFLVPKDAYAGAAPYTVPSDAPLTSHLHKSGGYTPDDPNAGFYQQWLNDRVLRLPSGTWEIKAWVQLLDGSCNAIGPNDVRDLWTTVRVVVTG